MTLSSLACWVDILFSAERSRPGEHEVLEAGILTLNDILRIAVFKCKPTNSHLRLCPSNTRSGEVEYRATQHDEYNPDTDTVDAETGSRDQRNDSKERLASLCQSELGLGHVHLPMAAREHSVESEEQYEVYVRSFTSISRNKSDN